MWLPFSFVSSSWTAVPKSLCIEQTSPSLRPDGTTPQHHDAGRHRNHRADRKRLGVVSQILRNWSGLNRKSHRVRCQVVASQNQQPKAESQWLPSRSMTRRSTSCSEGTGEWRSSWSRPENQILQAEMTEHSNGELIDRARMPPKRRLRLTETRPLDQPLYLPKLKIWQNARYKTLIFLAFSSFRS
jgi:hypothetical protein